MENLYNSDSEGAESIDSRGSGGIAIPNHYAQAGRVGGQPANFTEWPELAAPPTAGPNPNHENFAQNEYYPSIQPNGAPDQAIPPPLGPHAEQDEEEIFFLMQEVQIAYNARNGALSRGAMIDLFELTNEVYNNYLNPHQIQENNNLAVARDTRQDLHSQTAARRDMMDARTVLAYETNFGMQQIRHHNSNQQITPAQLARLQGVHAAVNADQAAHRARNHVGAVGTQNLPEYWSQAQRNQVEQQVRQLVHQRQAQQRAQRERDTRSYNHQPARGRR